MSYHTYVFFLDHEPFAAVCAHSERQARAKLEEKYPADMMLEEDEDLEVRRVEPGKVLDLR